jgi:hypothetical protein
MNRTSLNAQRKAKDSCTGRKTLTSQASFMRVHKKSYNVLQIFVTLFTDVKHVNLKREFD